MNRDQVQHTCEVLEAARGIGRQALLSLVDIPGDQREAYEISLAQMHRIAAWKIGGANPWSRKVFNNSESFFGPLHPNEVHLEVQSLSVDNLCNPLAEPEIMLQLGSCRTGDIGVCFARMAIGLEIPASVLPDDLKPELNAQIVDRAGAGALWVVGATTFDRDLLYPEFNCQVWKNGVETPVGSSANLRGGPLGAAAEFLRLAKRLNVTLEAGQWIATGGLTPAVPVAVGDVLRVRALCWDESLTLCE